MTTEAFSPGFSRIVPDGAPIEKVADGFMFTEGPVWNGRENHLTWTDIIGDTIWRWIPGEGTTAVLIPSELAGAAVQEERPNETEGSTEDWTPHVGKPSRPD